MTSSKRDRFPLILGAGLVVSLAAMVCLLIAGHPGLALAAAVVAVGFGMPLSGWLVAWPFLQADIVVRVVANGGSIARHELTDYPSPEYDALFRGLAKRRILVQQGDLLHLDPRRIGTVLGFFIKVRLTPGS